MRLSPRGYFSYLMRASLERPGFKERVGFSNLDELFEYIREDVSKTTSEDANEA
jgi:hypothetical protein